MSDAPLIYLAFSNDQDAHLDLLKDESRQVYRALRSLDRIGAIKVLREESAELSELFDDFTEYKDEVAIFHYGGHADGATLRLEGGAGHASGLAGLLGEQKNLKLVFLNGCSTLNQVDLLLNSGVPAVIATSVPIEDQKAQKFAVCFYQALAGRRTIGQAFVMAQKYLETEYGDSIEIGIRSHRGVTLVTDSDTAEPDAIPWGLYVKAEAQDDVLEWKLPQRRSAGLPQQAIQYIGKSFTANRFIMLVLDELIRYDPSLYEQMVIRENGSESLKDSKYFPEVIIRAFPWPIGSQILLLRRHKHANRDRLEQLVSTHVLTGQLLYYILLSDLWESVRNGGVELPADFATLQPLEVDEFSRADFLAETARIYEVFRASEAVPYLQEIEGIPIALADPEHPLTRARDFLESVRADLIADEIPADLDRLCLKTEQAVSVVLKEAAFLARYRILTVRDIGVVARRNESLKYDLDMGPLNASGDLDLTMYRDVRSRMKTAFSNSHSVLLVRDEDRLDESLNLSPFVVDKNTYVSVKKSESTAAERLAHVFMLAFREGNRLVYLSVDHGVFSALRRDEDRIHTEMTEEDFREGRNVTRAFEDDFGLAADLGLEEVVAEEDESPKVLEILRLQYDAFRFDTTPGLFK